MLRLSFLVMAIVPNIEFIDTNNPKISQLIVDNCVIEVNKSEINDTNKMIQLVEDVCWSKTSVESLK